MKPMMLKIKLLFLIIITIVFTHNANATAIPGGWTVDDSSNVVFNDVISGNPVASIDCSVYSGFQQEHEYYNKYVYSYKINNTSTAAFSYFSVEILGAAAAGIYDLNIDTTTGVIPDRWDLSGLPPKSIKAGFLDAINIGESSAILWFVGSGPASEGDGALVGFSDGYIFAAGSLPTPASAQIPEPTSILLISLGSLAVVRNKKKLLVQRSRE